MRLYCFTFYSEQIKKKGYLSLAANKDPKQAWVYARRAGSDKIEDIKAYLEKQFEGRSRSICVLTEMPKKEEYEHPYLNHIVHHADIVSFELDDLIKDGLVEAVWCKDNHETAKINPDVENIYRLDCFDEIDCSPLPWHDAKEAYGSPYNMLRHYFLVLTKGYIPREYIKVERKGDPLDG